MTTNIAWPLARTWTTPLRNVNWRGHVLRALFIPFLRDDAWRITSDALQGGDNDAACAVLSHAVFYGSRLYQPEQFFFY